MLASIPAPEAAGCSVAVGATGDAGSSESEETFETSLATDPHEDDELSEQTELRRLRPERRRGERRRRGAVLDPDTRLLSGIVCGQDRGGGEGVREARVRTSETLGLRGVRWPFDFDTVRGDVVHAGHDTIN